MEFQSDRVWIQLPRCIREQKYPSKLRRALAIAPGLCREAQEYFMTTRARRERRSAAARPLTSPARRLGRRPRRQNQIADQNLVQDLEMTPKNLLLDFL